MGFCGLSMVFFNSQIFSVSWSRSMGFCRCFPFACLSIVFFNSQIFRGLSMVLCHWQMLSLSWSINGFVQMFSVCWSMKRLGFVVYQQCTVVWVICGPIIGFVQQSDAFCFVVYQWFSATVRIVLFCGLSIVQQSDGFVCGLSTD